VGGDRSKSARWSESSIDPGSRTDWVRGRSYQSEQALEQGHGKADQAARTPASARSRRILLIPLAAGECAAW
jgi:hypothetical protein